MSSQERACPGSVMFCVFVPAGLKAYSEFFKTAANRFFNVELAFHHVRKVRKSQVEEWRDGKLAATAALPALPNFSRGMTYLLMPFVYLTHLIAVVKAGRLAAKSGRVEWFIGVNFFCAFCGTVLRRLGLVEKVIYRVLDFYPRPPSGVYHYMLPVYYWIDSFCLKRADFVWFTTGGHLRGRSEAGYFDPAVCRYTMIPLGVEGRTIAAKPEEKFDAQALVYIGVISRSHGLDLALDAIPELAKEFPGIKLHVIGSGPDEADVRRRVAGSETLAKAVVFHGYLDEDSAELRAIVSGSALALALYVPDPFGFMQYTEPAKAKLYLSCGTPVIITRVPDLAGDIERAGAGRAIRFEGRDFIDAVSFFLRDRGRLAAAREQALKYVSGFKVEQLLMKACAATSEAFGSDGEKGRNS